MLKELRKLPQDERKDVGEAMNMAAACWGVPHLHSGSGIRQLTGDIYECRVGRSKRLAFVVRVIAHELVFVFMGNHDQIQKFIKGAK